MKGIDRQKSVYHLYSPELYEQGTKEAMCGFTEVIPIINSLSAGYTRKIEDIVTICEKCKTSENHAFWMLAHM